MRKLFLLLLFSFASTLFVAPRLFAQVGQGTTLPITVKQTISDGANGRIFLEWRKELESSLINSVSVTVRRQSGDSKTTVIMYLGSQLTKDKAKGFLIQSDGEQTLSWDIQGNQFNEKLFTVSAQNGNVFIERVVFNLNKATGPITPKQEQNSSDSTRSDYLFGTTSAQDKWHNTDSNSKNTKESVDEECKNLAGKAPKIEVNAVSLITSAVSGEYKTRVGISGRCVVEAGYYEFNQLVEKFDFPYQSTFERKEFEPTVKLARSGEFRAYTASGKYERVLLDAVIARWVKLLTNH